MTKTFCDKCGKECTAVGCALTVNFVGEEWSNKRGNIVDGTKKVVNVDVAWFVNAQGVRPDLCDECIETFVVEAIEHRKAVRISHEDDIPF